MLLKHLSYQAVWKTLKTTVPLKNRAVCSTHLKLRAVIDSDVLVPNEIYLIVTLGKKTGSESDFVFTRGQDKRALHHKEQQRNRPLRNTT